LVDGVVFVMFFLWGLVFVAFFVFVGCFSEVGSGIWGVFCYLGSFVLRIFLGVFFLLLRYLGFFLFFGRVV